MPSIPYSTEQGVRIARQLSMAPCQPQLRSIASPFQTGAGVSAPESYQSVLTHVAELHWLSGKRSGKGRHQSAKVTQPPGLSELPLLPNFSFPCDSVEGAGGPLTSSSESIYSTRAACRRQEGAQKSQGLSTPLEFTIRGAQKDRPRQPRYRAEKSTPVCSRGN